MPGVLATEHGCDTRLQAEPFVREDVQRIASGSAADHAVVFADHLVIIPTPDALGLILHGAPVTRESLSPVLRI
jgi:hypothetical protein